MDNNHSILQPIPLSHNRHQRPRLLLSSILVVRIHLPPLPTLFLSLDIQELSLLKHRNRICSISTLVPDAYINDSPRTQGLLLIGLLVGLLFAEVVCSGHLSDKLMSHLARKNGGVRVPEMRLWLGYPAAVVSSVGLVLWGVSVDKDWHWMVGQVAFFLCKSTQLNCSRR